MGGSVRYSFLISVRFNDLILKADRVSLKPDEARLRYGFVEVKAEDVGVEPTDEFPRHSLANCLLTDRNILLISLIIPIKCIIWVIGGVA